MKSYRSIEEALQSVGASGQPVVAAIPIVLNIPDGTIESVLSALGILSGETPDESSRRENREKLEKQIADLEAQLESLR